jgi:hypothetical protein
MEFLSFPENFRKIYFSHAIRKFQQENNLEIRILLKEEQMEKKGSMIIGVTLVVLGVLGLAGNLLVRLLGIDILPGFHAWPILIIAAGLLFCIPPFIFLKRRGLSGLFIPGLPTLVTGFLLLVSSLSGKWSIWATLWPLEVISVGIAFTLMAIFLKIPWLMIPASIIGLTGLVLQFCASTGLWSSWAVLWAVVPLSVGLPLLIIGLVKKLEGVKLAGMIICGIAGIAFAAMSSFILTTNLFTQIIGPAVILGLGILLVVVAIRRPMRKEN